MQYDIVLKARKNYQVLTEVMVYSQVTRYIHTRKKAHTKILHKKIYFYSKKWVIGSVRQCVSSLVLKIGSQVWLDRFGVCRIFLRTVFMMAFVMDANKSG